MRVNISYSVEMGKLPEKMLGILNDLEERLKLSLETISLAKKSVSDGNINIASTLVEDCRLKSTDVVLTLQDISNILVGYNNIVESEEEDNEEFSPPAEQSEPEPEPEPEPEQPDESEKEFEHLVEEEDTELE